MGLTPGEFGSLVQTHARELWCIAAAVLGDRDLARDVVQDASIVGISKLREFAPGTSFVHWMGQIVRYTALNESRKRRSRRGALGAASSGLARGGPSAKDSLPADGLDPRLGEALMELDETARACLLLRTVLDLSYKHIAEALGIAEGTAMSHVHRSRHRLREALLKGGRDER